MTNAQRTKEIEARAAKATEGPWEADSVETEDGYGKYDTQEIADPRGKIVCEFSNSDGEVHAEDHRWDEKARLNASFIAHSRADIPWLLSTLRAVEADNARLRAALETIAESNFHYTTELPHAPDGSNRRVRGHWGKIARTALQDPRP